jgi:hypothetical protein
VPCSGCLKKGQSRLGSALSDRPAVLMASKGFVFSYKGENIRFDPFAPVPLYLLILFLHDLRLLSCFVWFRRLKISVALFHPYTRRQNILLRSAKQSAERLIIDRRKRTMTQDNT